MAEFNIDDEVWIPAYGEPNKGAVKEMLDMEDVTQFPTTFFRVKLCNCIIESGNWYGPNMLHQSKNECIDAMVQQLEEMRE